MKDLEQMRDIVWSLYESYHGGIPQDPPLSIEEDGWPEWGSYLDDDVADRRRAIVKEYLTSLDLTDELAEDLLQTVYWIHEHYVYTARELSEYIEGFAKESAKKAGWT